MATLLVWASINPDQMVLLPVLNASLTLIPLVVTVLFLAVLLVKLKMVSPLWAGAF